MHTHPFDISPISQRIWQDKYQLHAADGGIVDATIAQRSYEANAVVLRTASDMMKVLLDRTA